MLDLIINNAKNKIAKFIEATDVEVKVEGCVFEVRGNVFTLFSYNFVTGKVIYGHAHKVGYTPARLLDLSAELKAAA